MNTSLFGFSEKVNLQFDSLWNDCSNFSLLCVWGEMQEWEMHGGNAQRQSRVWCLLLSVLLGFHALILELVILRTIAPGWTTSLFVVGENQTSCLVDFAGVTQEWTGPVCVPPSAAAEHSFQLRMDINWYFQREQPVMKMSWPVLLVWWNGQMIEFSGLPNPHCSLEAGNTESASHSGQCACSGL